MCIRGTTSVSSLKTAKEGTLPLTSGLSCDVLNESSFPRRGLHVAPSYTDGLSPIRCHLRPSRTGRERMGQGRNSCDGHGRGTVGPIVSLTLLVKYETKTEVIQNAVQ